LPRAPRMPARAVKRTPPLPSEGAWGRDSTIGTLSVHHKNGLTETIIYPVLGSALVDVVVVLCCMVGGLLLWRSAAVTARRVLRRMRPIADAVWLPSQPHPVRLTKGCVRVADATVGTLRRWEVCDLATATQLLSHPAIGSDCLPSLLAPLLPAERREVAFLEASFREWPRFQEGAPQRQLHPTLSRCLSLEGVGAMRPHAARTCARLLARARQRQHTAVAHGGGDGCGGGDGSGSGGSSGGGGGDGGGGGERSWDVMAELARPLPLLLAAQLLGFAEEGQHAEIGRLGSATVHAPSTRYPGLLRRALLAPLPALRTRDERLSRLGPCGRLRCGRAGRPKSPILRRPTPRRTCHGYSGGSTQSRSGLEAPSRLSH